MCQTLEATECIENPEIKQFIEDFFESKIYASFSDLHKSFLLETIIGRKRFEISKKLADQILTTKLSPEYQLNIVTLILDNGAWKVNKNFIDVVVKYLKTQYGKKISTAEKSQLLTMVLLSGIFEVSSYCRSFCLDEFNKFNLAQHYASLLSLLLNQAIFDKNFTIKSLNLSAAIKYHLITFNNIINTYSIQYNTSFTEQQHHAYQETNNYVEFECYVDPEHGNFIEEQALLKAAEPYIKDVIQDFKKNDFSLLPQDLQDEFKELAEKIGMW